MAQPKNLKKLTRARMERTGESYTTARKAILTGNPEPAPAQRPAQRPPAQTAPEPEPELPEYPAPHDVVQYDAALWHRVLTQAGVTHPLTNQPLSEALLAGLAGGIGFMLHSFQDAQTTSITLVTRAHPEPYTATLLERCGAKVRIRTTGNAQAAAANLDAGLDAGRAVVVRVTRAALPWVEPASVDPEDTVDVAVLGEIDELLLIDDGAGQLQTISEADLAAARSRHKRDKNYCAWVPSSRTPEAQLLAASALAAVEQSTGRMLGTSDLAGLPIHYARNFGVTGMRQWAERLQDTTGDKGWLRLLAEPGQLRQARTQLERFLTDTRFAARDGLRAQFADFLTEAAALPGLSPLAGRAAGYRRLAARWEEFTAGLLAALSPDLEPAARAASFAELGRQLAELADAEEQAADALAEAAAAVR